jgi:trans-aconitate 2-methyltransferase
MTCEWNAAAYHRVSDPQFGWGLRLLERVSLAGNETVLDAGCGTGRLTTELLARLPGGRVVGVDLSENMMSEARQTLAKFGDRVLLVRADAAQLPFRERFDGVFSNATFHWVRNHPQLFASLFAALKPGGWLEVQCGGGPNLDRLHRRAEKLMAQPRFAPFFADWVEPWEFATAEQTSDRLRAAGFTAIKTWVEQSDMTWREAKDYKEYLATVVMRTYISRIPDAALSNDFLDEMVRLDPAHTLDYWRLNMSARKPL